MSLAPPLQKIPISVNMKLSFESARCQNCECHGSTAPDELKPPLRFRPTMVRQFNYFVDCGRGLSRMKIDQRHDLQESGGNAAVLLASLHQWMQLFDGGVHQLFKLLEDIQLSLAPESVHFEYTLTALKLRALYRTVVCGFKKPLESA